MTQLKVMQLTSRQLSNSACPIFFNRVNTKHSSWSRPGRSCWHSLKERHLSANIKADVCLSDKCITSFKLRELMSVLTESSQSWLKMEKHKIILVPCSPVILARKYTICCQLQLSFSLSSPLDCLILFSLLLLLFNSRTPWAAFKLPASLEGLSEAMCMPFWPLAVRSASLSYRDLAIKNCCSNKVGEEIWAEQPPSTNEGKSLRPWKTEAKNCKTST